MRCVPSPLAGLASNVVLRSDLATKNLEKGASLAMSLATMARCFAEFILSPEATRSPGAPRLRRAPGESLPKGST